MGILIISYFVIIKISKWEEKNVKIYTQNSKDSIIIQASDIIANNLWRTLMSNQSIENINVIKFFP